MTMQANTVKLDNLLAVALSKSWVRRLLITIALVLLDLVMIFISFRLAYAVRFEAGLSWFQQLSFSTFDFYQQFVLLLAPIIIIVFAIFGLYDFRNLFSGTREYSLVLNACTLAMMLVVFFTFFDDTFTIARGWVVLSWVFTILVVGLGRFSFRRVIHRLRVKGYFMTTVLVVGANEEGKAIAQQLQNNPRAGIRIAGFIDGGSIVSKESVDDIPVLGNIDRTTALAKKHHAQEVFIASTALTRDQLLNLVQTLHTANIPARLSSGMYEMLTTGVEVHDVGNVPLITINKLRLTGIEVFLKRILDLTGAITALALFFPIMVTIAIAVKIDTPGPIFHRRRVLGVGGKEFNAFKFRTMVADADAILAKNETLREQFEQNFKLKDDPRITRVGNFVRKTSLDELPQLFNVLLGQMSLVGPRMITRPESVHYGRWASNLLTVKPGITGMWQVSGRSDISYNERVKLDMHYIRNYTIWLDIYLLWQTIPAVLKRRGAY